MDFVESTATPLLLRPREFIANARDLVTLKAGGRRAGAALWRDQGAGHDHRRRCRQDRLDPHPFASVRGGGAQTKLIVLPGVGHMVQNAVPDLVVAEIEAMVGRIGVARRRRRNNASLSAALLNESRRNKNPGQAGVFILPRLRRRYFLSCRPCRTARRRPRGLLISVSFLMPANAILVPGIFAFGSLMYSLNCGLVPGDAGVLVGVGIVVAFHGARLAAVEPVELGADLVLGAFADRVAGQALVERGFAGGNVLRQRGCDSARPWKR